MLLGHFTKLQKYNVPINNVQLANDSWNKWVLVIVRMSARSPNFVSKAADCSSCTPLRQRMLGRQVDVKILSNFRMWFVVCKVVLIRCCVAFGGTWLQCVVLVEHSCINIGDTAQIAGRTRSESWRLCRRTMRRLCAAEQFCSVDYEQASRTHATCSPLVRQCHAENGQSFFLTVLNSFFLHWHIWKYYEILPL